MQSIGTAWRQKCSWRIPVDLNSGRERESELGRRHCRVQQGVRRSLGGCYQRTNYARRSFRSQNVIRNPRFLGRGTTDGRKGNTVMRPDPHSLDPAALPPRMGRPWKPANVPSFNFIEIAGLQDSDIVAVEDST